MYACWSIKGGSGTTVFASALALLLAEHHGEATVIDMGGDVPSVLGMAELAGTGIRDWLSSTDRDPQGLVDLRVAATSRLHVIPAGSASSFDNSALDDLVQSVTDQQVVVDFGSLQPPDSVRRAARADWLVVRPCYLALRRDFVDRKPVTWYALSKPGRKALDTHLSALRAVIAASGA